MPNNRINYHSHIHRDSSLAKIGDFLTDTASIGNGINVQEFLSYEDENGVKNIDNIFDLYSDDELKVWGDFQTTYTTKSEDDLYQLPLKIGTHLSLELVKVDRELRFTESNQVVNFADFGSFLAKQLRDLLKDKRYQQVYQTERTSVRDQFPYISVWVWSRVHSTNIDGTHKDVILNITPFISNLNTSNTVNGGNFSFSLPPIQADYVSDKWVMKENTVQFANGYQVSEAFKNTVNKDGTLSRADFYFEKVLQQNDVVFIRFEKLDIEVNRDKKDFEFEVSNRELPGKIFDMIGLVDIVSTKADHGNSNVSINISGRDLIKLFIEDGIYFYPSQFTDGGIFANTSQISADKLLRFDGQLNSRFQRFEKTIDRSLKFLINALSTIKVTSDSLFDAYGDARSKTYQLGNSQQDSVNKKIEDENSRVENIKRLIRKSINKEKLNSDVIATYRILYNFVDSIYTSKRKDNKTKVAIEDSQGDLAGWGEFLYGSEDLKEDIVTKQLDDMLYRNDRGWRDRGGNPVTFAEGQKLIADLEKEAKRYLNDIKATQQETEKLAQEIARVEESKKKKWNPKNYNTQKGNDMSQYITQMLKASNAQFAVTDPTGAAGSAVKQTGGIVSLNKTERERKIRLDLLNAEYLKVKSQITSIKSTVLKKDYNSLNTFALEAFKETYKLIRLQSNREEQTPTEIKPMSGIWQIVKLVIDPSIANRRLVDSSIGNEHGSLLNGIRKICQEPFCEFFTDTYGDQFYLIARKKPFDRESILSMIEGRVLTEPLEPQYSSPEVKDTGKEVKGLKGNSAFSTESPFNQKTNNFSSNINENSIKTAENKESNSDHQPLIIDIEEMDIIADDFSFSTEAYSWYKILPQNLIGGAGDSSIALAYLKAIYFEEYADIFGSKPLDVVTNYIPYFPIVDKNQKINVAYLIRQGMYDLKYLIDTHCYLPFTRQGSIIINPDRRIKRGTFVRIKSTGEIGFVDAVSNSYEIDESNIERTTTLQVSRLMKEEFISGKTEKGIKYSYFDIVSTEIDGTVFSNADFGYENFNKIVTNQWKVNKEVFNFFLKNLQSANFTTSRKTLPSNAKITNKLSQLDPRKINSFNQNFNG